MINHFLYPWNVDSVLFLQVQCLKPTLFKREVTLKVSEIYYYTFNFSCETMFIIIIIIISVFPIIIMLCFQRHKQYSFCVLLFLSLLKKCSKTFKNWSKGEHMKLVAMGPVLMWFVIWHSEESRGHNREANQVQLLQCYNFTLPSP